MILRLLQFIRGYVVVTVTGFSLERFLNLAANRGIYLWDVRWKDGAAVLKTSVGGFKLLRPCAKKTSCKVKLTRKVGVPFVLFRYRKRKFLALGVLFFIAFMYCLTSFVWLVTIEGNEAVSSSAIYEYLAECGLRPGALKYGFNLRLLENRLLMHFSDLAWVNVSIKGTRARVIVAETIPQPELVDKYTPGNVVADKDGLIVSMATSAGTPLVRPGDVVRRGDILVSGELKVGSEESGFYSYFVHARSEVYAKRYYEFSFNVPLSYTIKSFTGNTKRNYGIILFGNMLYIENTESPFANYERIYEEKRMNFGPDYPLPVVYFTETYKEFVPVLAERTAGEAESLGAELADARLKREFPEDTIITGKEISFEHAEGYIVVTVNITAVERIDETRPLAPETPLELDDGEPPGDSEPPIILP